jgi:hypothetical protein
MYMDRRDSQQKPAANAGTHGTMSEAGHAPVSQESQGEDAAVWDTCSRGFHSLSLDPSAQRYRFDVTFLLFARGIAGGRREPAVRTAVTIA